MESIEYKQDKGIRLIILILSISLFIIGFGLMYQGNQIWMIMHIAGFIGLGWDSILNKIHKEDKFKGDKE